MKVNFNIEDIFSKISEDGELQNLLLTNNILVNDNYKKEVTRRIERIYSKNFNLYSYWLGDKITKDIQINLAENIDLFEIIQIPDGTFRLEVLIGDIGVEEEYILELNSINFINLTAKALEGYADITSTSTLIVDNSVTGKFSSLDTVNYVVRIRELNKNYNIFKRITKVNANSIEVEEYQSSLSLNKYEILYLPNTGDFTTFLNTLIIKESNDIYIRDKIRFSSDSNNNIFLTLSGAEKEKRKIVLTISDSSFVGTQLSSYLDFSPTGTSKGSKQNEIKTFLNNEYSGFTSETPPWLSEFVSTWDAYENFPQLTSGLGVENTYYRVSVSGDTTIDGEGKWYVNDIIYFKNGKWIKNPSDYDYSNQELIAYTFFLDDIALTSTPLYKISYRFLFDFKYTGVDWFFYKNYIRFLPEFDYSEIQKNQKLKTVLESMLIEMDRLASLVSNMSTITNPDTIPEDMLDHLSALFAFEKEEYQFNKISFRELLKNIIEIYKVKGTNYSLELFFRFLGYKLNVTEYWFDRREVFNNKENPYTNEINYDNFKHYLTINKPTFERNKYNLLETYDNMVVPEGFDNINRTEIQESLNLFEFLRRANSAKFNFVLQLLGFGGVPPQFNNTWSFNVNKTFQGEARFPFNKNEILNTYDISQYTEPNKTTAYRENDLEIFRKETFDGDYNFPFNQPNSYNSSSPGEISKKNENPITTVIYFNNQYLFIKDKQFVPNFFNILGYNFEYFKTNYVAVELTPFKLELTSNDIKVVDKYLRLLFPSYIFYEPKINLVDNKLEQIRFFEDYEHFSSNVYENIEPVKFDVVQYQTYKFGGNFRFEHEVAYEKAKKI